MAIVLGKDAIVDVFSRSGRRDAAPGPGELKIPLSYHTPGADHRSLVVPCSRTFLTEIPAGQRDIYDYYGVVTIDTEQLRHWMDMGSVRGVYRTGQEAKAQADLLNRDVNRAIDSHLRNLASINILPHDMLNVSLISRYDRLKATELKSVPSHLLKTGNDPD